MSQRSQAVPPFRPISPLRQARQHAGLTQESLAQLSGTRQYNITDFEVGRRQPSPKLAAAIAGALGLTTREVFPGLETSAAADPKKSEAGN